jgi:hypothetical protein
VVGAPIDHGIALVENSIEQRTIQLHRVQILIVVEIVVTKKVRFFVAIVKRQTSIVLDRKSVV